MKDNTASDIAKLLGSHGGKTTSKLHGKIHYQKLAEHMNKIKRLKRLKSIPENKLTMDENEELKKLENER